MAQDFGDDVGEMLFIRLLGRYCEKAAGIVLKASLTDAVQRYHQQKLELEGKSKEEAAAEAEVLAKRPQVCVPFGDATRASYFAKVCQDNGVGAFAFSDGKGNGYVSFAKDDVAKVQDCVPQFSKVMTSLKYREINDLLEKAEPVPQEMFDKLKQMDLPDIDKNLYEHDVTLFPVQVEVDGKNEMWTFAEQDTKNLDIDAQVNVSNQSAEHMKEMVGKEFSGVTIRAVGEPYQVKAMELHENAEKGHADKGEPDVGHNERQGHDLANDPYSHTDLIRDKVLAAREQCRDFEDFKAILAENGIGTRFNDEGELQFYEGRLGENGEMLDFVNGTDWPVNAKTLAGDKYQCDATLDWFEKNTPKEPSGIDSLNHAHSPIPPQKDLNLICNAVRSDLEERGIQTLDRADGKMGFPNKRLPAAQSFYEQLTDGGGQDYNASDETQKAIVDAAKRTPSPGAGYCAAWVSNVYENAGLPRPGGNACCQYLSFCTSTDRSQLKVGMVIGVQRSPTSNSNWCGGHLGYGHVGIYIGDGKVMENVGHIATTDLDSWIAYNGQLSQPRWGFPPGVH